MPHIRFCMHVCLICLHVPTCNQQSSARAAGDVTLWNYLAAQPCLCIQLTGRMPQERCTGRLSATQHAAHLRAVCWHRRPLHPRYSGSWSPAVNMRSQILFPVPDPLPANYSAAAAFFFFFFFSPVSIATAPSAACMSASHNSVPPRTITQHAPLVAARPECTQTAGRQQQTGAEVHRCRRLGLLLLGRRLRLCWRLCRKQEATGSAITPIDMHYTGMQLGGAVS
jgi:hypothetical protein